MRARLVGRGAEIDWLERALIVGFRQLPVLSVPLGPGRRMGTALLDFGPGPLAWISGLIDVQNERAGRSERGDRGFDLDREARELVVEGERRALTRLEFGLLDYLDRRAGAVCSRDELLESVWGQAHTGSNVVDAVVRSLRKKLGPHAGAIWTVTGRGYKLRVD